MAYGAVHQTQTRLDGPLAYLLDLLAAPDALNMRIRAEFEIDLVRIFYGLLCELFTYKLRELAAHLRAQ